MRARPPPSRAVRAWNAPSLRVLDKLGFRPSGRVDPDPERGDVLWFVRNAARA
jgi:RimJ/RimL family protein N-acetyltransferase